MELKLTASTRNEELVLEYLKENASERLADKINSGKKTLADCWKFITDEAKKKAKNGCACIEDREVYGWAVHFFEEDDIKCAASKADTGKKPGKASSKKPEERKTVKKLEYEQLSLFDMV